MPVEWDVAIFNGLVTGGAETGSSGNLDDNFAYSARLMWYPTGEWGEGQMADFDVSLPAGYPGRRGLGQLVNQSKWLDRV